MKQGIPLPPPPPSVRTSLMDGPLSPCLFDTDVFLPSLLQCHLNSFTPAFKFGFHSSCSSVHPACLCHCQRRGAALHPTTRPGKSDAADEERSTSWRIKRTPNRCKKRLHNLLQNYKPISDRLRRLQSHILGDTSPRNNPPFRQFWLLIRYYCTYLHTAQAGWRNIQRVNQRKVLLR